MRRQARALLVAAALAALAPAAAALAQPFLKQGGGGAGGGMPNLRAISGRPLPDAGMAVGTVSVRVARKSLANAAAGLDVAAISKNAGGDLRKRSGKTDAGGRVLFEGLATGDEFHAEVTVDGELLKTDTFTIPSQGGVRTMLISGLPPPGSEPEAAGPGAGGGAQAFAMGSSTGTAKPEPSVPVKTLEVRLVDEAGRPVPNHPITLGSVDQSQKVDVKHAETDATGVARFTGLTTGRTVGYAAVADFHGLHIGTEPFAMPDDSGVRAEIHALERTSDPSVVTIGEGARIVLQMREDTLQFLEFLPLENKSDKLFDPGPGAVEITLPSGFTGGEAGESDRKIEIRKNHGAAVHGTISPRRALGDTDAKQAGNEVTIGFVLPYEGDSKDFAQPMPTGIGLYTLIMEQIPGMEISGPGVGQREAKELNGKKYWVMPGSAVPPGGVLHFTVTGLPSIDHSGRIISAALTIALILAAFAFGRRPVDETRRAAASERDRLTARRENLFAELVAVERQTRGGSATAPERRRELVGKLEGVYQQLAALDEQRAP
jgi:hypothetical protein